MFRSKLYLRRTERTKPKEVEPVEIRIMIEGKIQVLTVTDISVLGIGVRARPEFIIPPVMSNINIVVCIPRRKPFLVRSMVRHVREQDCFGLEFVSINDSALIRIEHYIAALDNKAMPTPSAACVNTAELRT